MTTAFAPDHLLPAWQFSIADAMPAIAETGYGTWEVKGLKIFKSGTVKDSRGRQKKWTSDELDQIVSNFNKLRGTGQLADIPVRADHTNTVDSVKGYFTGLRHEGVFLVADIEFTEPDGAEKYRRKTYRHRSIEIGAYETNGDEPETYAPVALGLAFVDLGAVEGLFSKYSEDEVTTEAATFRITGVPTTDVAAVQAHIDELEKAQKPEPLTHAFHVAGAEQADFAKVQAHIDGLETFKAEQLDAARDTFVDGLVTEKKIGAPQAEALKTFAKGLTVEQYEAWKTTYATAPALFSKVGDGNGSANAGGNVSPEEAEAATNLEIVRNHRRTGLSEEAIAKTVSFRRYVALTGKEPV